MLESRLSLGSIGLSLVAFARLHLLLFYQGIPRLVPWSHVMRKEIELHWHLQFCKQKINKFQVKIVNVHLLLQNMQKYWNGNAICICLQIENWQLSSGHCNFYFVDLTNAIMLEWHWYLHFANWNLTNCMWELQSPNVKRCETKYPNGTDICISANWRISISNWTCKLYLCKQL